MNVRFIISVLGSGRAQVEGPFAAGEVGAREFCEPGLAACEVISSEVGSQLVQTILEVNPMRSRCSSGI